MLLCTMTLSRKLQVCAYDKVMQTPTEDDDAKSAMEDRSEEHMMGAWVVRADLVDQTVSIVIQMAIIHRIILAQWKHLGSRKPLQRVKSTVEPVHNRVREIERSQKGSDCARLLARRRAHCHQGKFADAACHLYAYRADIALLCDLLWGCELHATASETSTKSCVRSDLLLLPLSKFLLQHPHRLCVASISVW